MQARALSRTHAHLPTNGRELFLILSALPSLRSLGREKSAPERISAAGLKTITTLHICKAAVRFICFSLKVLLITCCNNVERRASWFAISTAIVFAASYLGKGDVANICLPTALIDGGNVFPLNGIVISSRFLQVQRVRGNT